MRRDLAWFLLVGACGFAVDLAAFLLTRPLMPDVAARVVALLVAVTVTWALNRRWTFRSANPDLWGEWTRYAATSALGAGVNAGVSLSLLAAAPALGATLALAAGSVTAAAFNFVFSRYVVFRSL